MSDAGSVSQHKDEVHTLLRVVLACAAAICAPDGWRCVVLIAVYALQPDRRVIINKNSD